MSTTPAAPDGQVTLTEDRKSLVAMALQAQRPLMTWGATLDSCAPGTVSIRLPVSDDICTAGMKAAMGGVVATLADVAAGLSILTALDTPRPFVTLDFTSHQIGPATGPELLAIGQVEKIGRTIAICSTDVFSLDGTTRRKCARLTATFALN